MTLDQFQRGMVVQFAWSEASRTGSLACMKAVCLILRNRLKAGWYDGSWIAAVEHAPEVAGNVPQPRLAINMNDRLFQMLLRDVDDIFYSSSDDETQQVVGECLYYMNINLPPREWFVEKIIRDPENHARRAHVGPIAMHL